jgi:dTDP-4-dehydrorhamnose 3,5-epimerase
LKVIKTSLEGFLVIEPVCFQDDRGFFLETYQSTRYHEVGIIDKFVQDNQSRSLQNILRGLHFQINSPQSQIVTVIRGCIFDVGVDLRPRSKTFGQWFGIELSDDSGPRQVYMAPGFAHGFCVLSPWADLHYKTNRLYDPSDEGGLIWNDPQLNIDWPINKPQVSRRDLRYPRLKDLTIEQLPHDSSILD